MGVSDSLLSKILSFQIDQWRPKPFDYTPTKSQIESQVSHQYPDYKHKTIQEATARFAKQYLKIRPLKQGAFLNESAIIAADEQGLAVDIERQIQQKLIQIMFAHFEQQMTKDSVSREVITGTINAEPNHIDQNLYLLWTRGEVEVHPADSSQNQYQSALLTEFGRKRYCRNG